MGKNARMGKIMIGTATSNMASNLNNNVWVSPIVCSSKKLLLKLTSLGFDIARFIEKNKVGVYFINEKEEVETFLPLSGEKYINNDPKKESVKVPITGEVKFPNPTWVKRHNYVTVMDFSTGETHVYKYGINLDADTDMDEWLTNNTTHNIADIHYMCTEDLIFNIHPAAEELTSDEPKL